MTENKEKIIDRLKKLFALGNSPNQHEAELALAKANEMMAEYQIGMTDIDFAEQGAAVKEMFDMKEADYDRRRWVAILTQACAKMYDAEAYSVSGAGWVQRFYGTPADILAAKMTLEHLYKSWKSIVEQDWFNAIGTHTDSKVTFKNAHGNGFAAAVSKRIDQLARERQAKVLTATGRDLVVVKSAAIEELRAGTKTQTRSGSFSGSNTAFGLGKSRGNVIPLHGSVSSQKPLAIGGRK